ncbi:hypothetical protein CYMTET_6536 [Cymbomonas tetramitiformis]|uniref:Uncharacterized protein n=1 Tax=Cymbomonas tetramitiformis TaxID=36881 RepID=A0AAE0GYS8_9CHLO|nr:hypothetical protein CYMTET_6536 [Cymbomonas tetramitiformis]
MEEHLQIAGSQEEGTTEGGSRGAQAGSSGFSQAALNNVEGILTEWEDLLSPGMEGGVGTQEQGKASPEVAMALVEGGVAREHMASHQYPDPRGEVAGRARQ